MQNDLISRKALRLSLKRQPSKLIDGKQYIRLDAVLEKVRIAPSSDAVLVVHAMWATDKEDIVWGNSLKRKYCTNCGKRPHFDKEKREFVLTDYCPHCGAKMDGGAEG